MRFLRQILLGLSAALALTLGFGSLALAADITSAPNYSITGGATGITNPLFITQDASGGTYVASANDSYVRYFAPGSQGNVQPTRVISGGATRLNAPYGLAVDSAGLLYVANYLSNEITVYSPTADGNAAPLYRWLLQGVSGPRGLAFEPGTDFLAVTNDTNVQFYSNVSSNAPTLQRALDDAPAGYSSGYRQSIAFTASSDFYIADFAGRVRHYAAGASGTTAPDRTISGAATNLDQVWSVQVQPVTNKLYVVVDGNTKAVLVFAATANGNVAPLDRYIGGSTQIIAPKVMYLNCNQFMLTDGVGAVLNFSTIDSVSCPTPAPAPAPSPSSDTLAKTGSSRGQTPLFAGIGASILGVGAALTALNIRRRGQGLAR